MPRFASKLIKRSDVADGTTAFAFERPAGFDFIAGQYLTVTLPDPLYNDPRGNLRTFSIASPPYEGNHLLVATRMTGSPFKRSLAEAALGATVSLFGPAGNFTPPAAAATPLVFIAGGIGITPFRSMILAAARDNLPHQITLLYANRMPEAAAFHEELAGVAATRHNFRYVPTMNDMAKSQQSWNGERRFISADLLREYIGDITRQTFYVAGPPGLVTAVTKALLEAGADSSHLISEEFTGYGTALVAGPDTEQSAPLGLVSVAKKDDVAPGRMKAVSVSGKQILLCNVAGEYYAVANECPHSGGVLSEGELAGKSLTCPLHGAVFDVTTGAVLEPPADEALVCYDVHVSGDTIVIKA